MDLLELVFRHSIEIDLLEDGIEDESKKPLESNK